MPDATLPIGWFAVDADQARVIESEVRRELTPGHALFAKRIKVLAVGESHSDDVIVQVIGEPHGFAFVHLTWQKESSPDWPYCRVYDTLAEIGREDD